MSDDVVDDDDDDDVNVDFVYYVKYVNCLRVDL